jgi:transcription termination factor Rho
MELRNLKLSELKELAKSKGIHDAYKYKKDELILKLNEIESDNNDESKETINDSKIPEDKKETEQEMELPDKIVEEIESSGTEALKVTGILETHSDGYGFLRTNNYLTSDDDVYISPSQIRRFHMQTGDKISEDKINTTYKALISCITTLPPKQFVLLSTLIGILLIDDIDPKDQIILGKFINNIGQTILTAAAQEQINIKKEN